MSKFTFKIVNNRGDETQLNLLLTVAGENSGLEGIEIGKSTVLADFFSRNASHSFSAEKLVSCRLYVGYGAMTSSPDPNSNQYYGWIEFSRDPGADKGVWLNLSNVDIVGLPMTLGGKTVEGPPFSLGYRKPVNDIITEIKTRALTSQGPAVVKDCGGGRTKIVAPNIQFPFYRSYDDYLNSLTQAGASLTIRTDTPLNGSSKTFAGNFTRGAYRSLPDQKPILTLKSGADTFEIMKSQFNTEYLYRCDGGQVVFNGQTVPQNQNDQGGRLAPAVYTNSLFRNLCIGINEGYFTPGGANDSSKFSSDKPFQNGQGSVYARIIHESSNSYGFPYADSNLKTLLLAAIDTPITLAILKDDESGGYQG
jgi:hypothetical protein